MMVNVFYMIRNHPIQVYTSDDVFKNVKHQGANAPYNCFK